MEELKIMIIKNKITFSLIAPLLFATTATLAEAQCIFCDIVNRQAPAKIIAENDDVLVFESIRPIHPTHCLIVPKKHLPDLKSARASDIELIGKVFMAASDLGKQLDGAQAFNLQINNGAGAGQTVFHFHVHFTSPNTLTTPAPRI
jgi:histidine triad (HIT) family protein